MNEALHHPIILQCVVRGTPHYVSINFGLAEVFGVFCSIVSFLYTLAFPLLFIGFLVSGFLFLVSGGDEERVAKARGALIATIIATVLVVVAAGIPSVVADAIGITLEQPCL